MAEVETAVKAGWGLDGREVGENVCVGGKGLKHIPLAFFSPSFPWHFSLPFPVGLGRKGPRGSREGG